MNISPVFTRPETWSVLQDCTQTIALAPVLTDLRRNVSTGCSFRGCNMMLEVPSGWHEDRVNALIAKFRDYASRSSTQFETRKISSPFEDDE